MAAARLAAAVLKSGARRRPWRILAAAVLAGAALLIHPPLSAPLARALLDVQLRLLAPAEASRAVVVFDIDDASLAELKPHFGNWPFKRDVYALVVEQLRELGARAVAIDLVLADTVSGDEALARALARPGAPVLLAAAGLREAGRPLWPSDSLQSAAPPPMQAAPRIGGPLPTAHGAEVPAYAWPMIALPAPSVWPPAAEGSERRAPLLGVITTSLDDDGVLRRLPLWHRDATLRLPIMSWAVHAALQPQATLPPLDREGAFLFPMPRAQAQPVRRSFAELAGAALGQRDAAALRPWVDGRVVFIGSSALWADTVMTPQGQVSGTALLAQAYVSLKEGLGVRPASVPLDVLLLALALAPAALAVRRGRPGRRQDLIAAGIALVAMGAVALLALLLWRQPAGLVPALGAWAIGLAMALHLQQRGQGAARRRLAHALAVSEEATRAKSAFLANVSHEIRTPLNALLGVAELLAASELTPEQRLHVQVFRESGQSLHTLINELLDLSKIEAGRLEVQAAPFDLRHSLRQVTALMRPRAEDKGLALTWVLDPALPTTVLGDRLRLEQMLNNLLGNAVKFTARGEVSLSVRPEGRPGRVCLEVRDSGIGIVPDKLEQIFEPFAQADNSVTRQYGGTGLGLAITRRLATLMGGTVQVQSTVGAGSTFTLRLPLPAATAPALADDAAPAVQAVPAIQAERAERAGAAAAQPLLPAPLGPISVLLAEDNEVNSYLFSAMLQGQPLAIEFARDGASALQMLLRRRYDIAFMDQQMPGLDGLTVTRELRRLEAASGRARTPVVALTANAFATDVRASVEAGCDLHMAKPFSRAGLLEAIHQLAMAPDATQASGSHGAEGSEGAKNARGTERGDAVALPALELDAALQRLGGDADLYFRMAAHASTFLRGWVAQFEQARAEGQRARAHRLAHDLKGISATLGASHLAEQAAALESALRSVTTAEQGPAEAALAPWPAEASGRQLRAALHGVIAELTAHLAAAAPRQAPGADSESQTPPLGQT